MHKFPLLQDSCIPKAYAGKTKCDICDEAVTPVYLYMGHIKINGVTDENVNIDCACVRCIVNDRVTHWNEEWAFLRLTECVIDPERSKEEIRLTPDIATWMQYEDWPVCCKELALYLGEPTNLKELIDYSNQNIYWAQSSYENKIMIKKRFRKPKRNMSIPNFAEHGGPECLEEVNYFKCRVCSKKYWTWQYYIIPTTRNGRSLYRALMLKALKLRDASN